MASALREATELSVANRPKGTSEKDARAKALDDVHWDYENGYIIFTGNENLLEGHFIDARQLARDHKIECRPLPLWYHCARGHHLSRATCGLLRRRPGGGSTG